MAVAAVLVLLALPISTPSPRNAAAEAVVEESRRLGIDFRQGKERAGDGAPSSEAVQALSSAGAGTWVDAQIQEESAEIGEPPSALRDYLERNRDALWSVVAALERGEPDWGPAYGENGHIQLPFLPVLRLGRVLVAAALVEERDGRSIEGDRALEAAWVLARSVSSPNNLMTQLIAISAERTQIGALRKLRAPPLQWLGRLSSDGSWSRMPETLRSEGSFRPHGSRDPLQEMSSEVAVKALSAVADSLEKRTPCDPVLASDREIWKPAIDALTAETNATKRAIRDFYEENMGESIGNAVRRVARLEVDREMTLKILQLRLERESSPEGRWPEKLADPASAVCPEARYSYEYGTEAIVLRFLGVVESPKGALPLSFRARSDAPEAADTNTSASPSSPSPTPGAGAEPSDL